MNVNAKHKKLKDLVGGWAYRALCHGRPLCVWRNSSPHNWFIPASKKYKHEFLWHSDDGPQREFPDLNFFEKLHDSNNKVVVYWGSDSGMPCLSKYILKDRNGA